LSLSAIHLDCLTLKQKILKIGIGNDKFLKYLNNMLRKLIIIRGEEASGKTTFVEELKKLKIISANRVIIKDEVARDLGYTHDMEYTNEVRNNLYKTFFERIQQLANDNDEILVEAPFSDQGKVEGFLDVLKNNISVKTEINILTLVADYEVRSKRAQSRKELVGFSRNIIGDNRVPFFAELNLESRNLKIKTKIIDVSKLAPREIVKMSNLF